MSKIRTEQNIVDAIRHWVIYGFHPGSHTAWVLMGDKQKAWDSAHEHLKEQELFDELYVNHRSLVPNCLLDLDTTEFMEHKGIANMTSEESGHIEFDIMMSNNVILTSFYESTFGMRLKLNEGLKQLREKML